MAEVLPAHAGMIPWLLAACIRVLCAPRACGDDPKLEMPSQAVLQCSPRMRG